MKPCVAGGRGITISTDHGAKGFQSNGQVPAILPDGRFEKDGVNGVRLSIKRERQVVPISREDPIRTCCPQL
jgi:hypothetical protein